MEKEKILEGSERQSWMATLAKANLEQLEQGVDSLATLPEYGYLRPPEIGLAMVRGRAGGTGELFNLGEITVTRCVVQIKEDKTTGFGYVAGRSRHHAELAALCDALMQMPDWHDSVLSAVIEPLEKEAQRLKSLRRTEAEATKVNFFTLVRGES